MPSSRHLADPIGELVQRLGEKIGPAPEALYPGNALDDSLRDQRPHFLLYGWRRTVLSGK